MYRPRLTHLVLLVASLVSIAISTLPLAANDIGDERAVKFHILQRDIDEGRLDAQTLIRAGRLFFETRFTVLDGAGRPGATGAGDPTRRPLVNAKQFLRTSGPDSNSCAGCHNQPEAGGSGDIVANVFVGAQEREPVLLSISPEFSAERGTPEMHGSGIIELLAREMTADLLNIRTTSIERARFEKSLIRLPLITKGVHFGFITAYSDGTVNVTEVDGVDKDLIIRPWSQKGVVTSLRTFSVTALNHHHGIQATERFGLRRTGSLDFDRDGVEDEFTEGDVTALVLFQATLPVPVEARPTNPSRAATAEKGKRLFDEIHCANCHRPSLILNSPVYSEPGAYNLEGTLRQSEVREPIKVDLTKLPWSNRLEQTVNGQVIVHAYTDLKRHRIADSAEPFFANERVSQGFAPTDEFITRRLWGVGSTAPYGHRGDLTTLNEAILRHGGEAHSARLGYEALSSSDKAVLIEFLKTLQIVSVPLATSSVESDSADHGIAKVIELWQDQERQDSNLRKELASRVEAAAYRVESSLHRARVLALRVHVERIRAGSPPWDGEGVQKGSPLRIVSEIERTLRERGVKDSTLDVVLEAAQRSEEALAATHMLTYQAIAEARFAHPGTPDVQIGHLDPSVILADLSGMGTGNDSLGALKLLATWCEDLAFQAEQLSQHAGWAATRAEAAAAHISHSGKPPAVPRE